MNYFIYLFCIILFCGCQNANKNIKDENDYNRLAEMLLNCELIAFKNKTRQYKKLPTNEYGLTLLYNVVSHCDGLSSSEINYWEMVSDTNTTVDIINYIISKGCDINHINSMEKNVLYSSYHSPSCIYALVENGINLNYVYQENQTILEILIQDLTQDDIDEIPLDYDKIDNFVIQKLMSISFLISKGARLSNTNLEPDEYLLKESKARPLLYEYLVENGLPQPDIIKK